MDPEDDNIKQPNSIDKYANHPKQLIDMSHFAYACKTEGKNGISRLISETA